MTLPSFREQVARSLPAPPAPRGWHLFPSASAAGEEDSRGPSQLRDCYERLAGDACDGIWSRTLDALGGDEPASHEAVDEAYLYVCASHAYPTGALCGAFRDKAAHLKADAARYQRKFRDQPASSAPACPAPSADDAPITQAELDLLDDAAARLEPRSQQILNLAYRDQLTDAVIGTRLKPPLTTARVRVLRRRAEVDLRALLKRCR